MRHPIVYQKYREYCNAYRDRSHELLGMIQPISIDGDRKVFNLFGQLRHGKGLRTDYNTLRFIAAKLIERRIAVDLPWGISCGLGGGDWAIVEPIFDPVAGRWFRSK